MTTFDELDSRWAPFRIMSVMKLGHSQTLDQASRVWGWFFYNTAHTVSKLHHRPACYTFWGYTNTKLNFSCHHVYDGHRMQCIIDKKITNNYVNCSLNEVIEFWPEFQNHLREHFLASIMSEKVFLLRSKDLI
jgi:hypothetical protein